MDPLADMKYEDVPYDELLAIKKHIDQVLEVKRTEAKEAMKKQMAAMGFDPNEFLANHLNATAQRRKRRTKEEMMHARMNGEVQ